MDYIVTQAANVYQFEGKIIVREATFTNTDTGHLKIIARTESDTYTYECDITNTRGNMPSCVLTFSGEAKQYPFTNGGFMYDNTAYFTVSNVVNNGFDNVASIVPVSPLVAGMYGYRTYIGTGGATKNVDFTIEADFPIFCGEATMILDIYGQYLSLDNTDVYQYRNEVAVDGNYEHVNLAVNFGGMTNDIPHNEVWSIQNFLKVDGVLTSTKGYDFRIKPDAKIYIVYHDKGLNGDGTPNFILHITESPWEQKPYHAPDIAYAETNALDTDYWLGYWTDYDSGTSYAGYGSTNIPIYDSDEKGQAYAQGLIGIEDAINSGETTITSSTIGDDLAETEIPAVNLAVSGVGCNIYALSEAQIKTLMSDCLYQTDPTIINNVKDALWTWGNNPIDFFIDCYYVPFDISNFYNTDSAGVKFGTYVFTNYVYPIVTETSGSRKTLFNTTFEGVYGDWRDYTQFEYDLFLPFIGFVKLDVAKYLNKKVRCEMMFDLTTHNLRYYLFCDDVITDRFDGSVGINIPLMASDMVNKAKNDRQAGYDYVGRAVQLASSPLSWGGGQNPISSAVNGILGAKQALEKGMERARESVNGGFASSMNVYDITMAYLRIREKQLVIPDTIHSLYNYPSYYMGPISALSGYCELVNARFSSTATQPEIEEIESLLRNGVIL